MITGAVTRSHTLIVPLVSLSIVLLEGVVEYHLRLHITDVRLRTLAIMLCYALGFSLGGSWIYPRLKVFIVRLRSTSRRGQGRLGVFAFFLACYGALYYGFFLLETRGPLALWPWVTVGP